jgi:ubiquinone/menaquinone biosynthesis C-methylase UbiE
MRSQEENQEEQRVQKVYEERRRIIPADRYSLSNPGNVFLLEERDQHLISGLSRFGCMPLSEKRILDIGCGHGWQLCKFMKWGARSDNLFGVDLIPDHIERAKSNLPPQATVEAGSATNLNYSDETFDVVSQLTVFSSILHEGTRVQVAKEMLRVLRPSGCIIWYDFFVDNPWNQDVRGVPKSEIRRLFPGCRFHFERITVAAPLARTVGKIVPRGCEILSRLKVFSTHYLGFFHRPEASDLSSRQSTGLGDAA